MTPAIRMSQVPLHFTAELTELRLVWQSVAMQLDVKCEAL